jgi:hypothetical protein
VLELKFLFLDKNVYPRLSRSEFSRRFVMRMLTHPAATPLHGGFFVGKHAEQAAMPYWSKVHPDGLSPEQCADDDMSYWGL